MKEPIAADADARCRRYAAALGVLTALFGLRVAGQALQRFVPVEALPSYEAFHSPALPYSLLLAVQLFLFALMCSITYDVALCNRRRNPQAARLLGWIGALYMIGSLARIAAGLALDHPAEWFTSWIPAIFHLVLAAFVLTLAAYHATVWRGAQAAPAA
ncbi:MAG TPA: hypothetical protein VHP37_19225 [Burkholderiales bacterium]|nr:hypothetical protein [Burkholderiales bacterium]